MRCTLMLMVVVVLGALWPASAFGQAAPGTFQELGNAGLLKTYDKFIVTRIDETRVTGRMEELKPGTLRLRAGDSFIDVSEAEVKRIECRDPADDGMLLGALAGAGVLAASAAADCGSGSDPNCRVYWVAYLGLPAIAGGGLAGYLVDRAIRRVVFDATAARAPRLTVSPVISRHHRGATLSIAW